MAECFWVRTEASKGDIVGNIVHRAPDQGQEVEEAFFRHLKEVSRLDPGS